MKGNSASGPIRFALCTLLLIWAVGVIDAQDSSQDLLQTFSTASLGGEVSGSSDDLMRTKVGVGAQIAWIPSWFRYGGGVLTVDATQALIRNTQSTYVQMLRAEAGLQLRLPIGDAFGLYVQGTGGYGGARIQPAPSFLNGDESASSYSWRAAFGVELVLGPVFTSLDVGWDSFANIYEGVSGRVGIGWQFGGLGTRGVQPVRREGLPLTPSPLNAQAATSANLAYSNLNVDPVFPVLYKYYDTAPLGSVTITNDGDATLEDVEVVLDMATYIDNPKVSGRFEALGPGESVDVALAALFNEKVRSITEGEKVAAVIRTTYRIGDAEGSDDETVTVDFYDRNAIRWDDDRKVAAFVTTRDTELQPLARSLGALARQNRRDAVSANFQLGVMMFLAMEDQGLAYVVDPSSSYEDFSKNPLAIDFVQFPRQTFNFRGGDCDDLSVTYATLLESVGVPTAFLTTPGHIFAAFRLDMSADEARSTFSRPQDLIFRDDGTVWVPVETTLLESSFVQAWSTGAQEWREYVPSGTAAFYTTADSWSVYQPVAYIGDERIRPFNENSIEVGFGEQMTGFVKREIAERELRIKARLQGNPTDARLNNRLGVLYARYGLKSEAEAAFRDAIGTGAYAPALSNLGNIAFLDRDYETALDYYQKAVDSDPNDDTGLLGIARVNHELENYGTVARYYDQVKEHNPALAEQYAYLELRGDDAARASDAAQVADRVSWGEEGDE